MFLFNLTFILIDKTLYNEIKMESKVKENIFYVVKDTIRNPNKHIVPELIDTIRKNNLNNENIEYVTLTVFLTYSYSYSYHKFILPTRITGPNRISLNDIIDEIDTYDHIILENYSISYRINNEDLLSINEEEKEVFLFVGLYPLECNYSIEIPSDNILIINLRPIINKTDSLRLELYEEEGEIQDDNKKKNYFVNINSKRAKERKIGYIIKKVYLWKKLYEGLTDKNGLNIKMTLQDAAEKVDISKKSLDEYLNQIRFGKALGFDFNKHRNEKVGVLRGFVKTQMLNSKGDNSECLKKKKKKQNHKKSTSNIEEINITIDETNKKE